MSNKIFLRIGSWYRATDKALLPDIDMSAIIQDVNAEYPVIKDDGGGGSTTIQQAIDNGAVLDKDNEIVGAAHNLDMDGFGYVIIEADGGDSSDGYSQLEVEKDEIALYSRGTTQSDKVYLTVTPSTATIKKTIGGVEGDAKEIATDLQSALDGGAILDKDNTISADGHSFSVVNASYSAIQSNITGEDTYSSVYVQAGQAVIDVYDNDTGDEVTLKLTPNSATIDKGAGAKEIATESAISTDIVIAGAGTITVTNGIITGFIPE